MRAPFALIGAILLLAASLPNAAAQSPQFVPAYPLYCQARLPPAFRPAGKPRRRFNGLPLAPAPPTRPRAVRLGRPGAGGIEIVSGGGNVICDFSSAMQSVPAGTFVEVGVARDPRSTTACTWPAIWGQCRRPSPPSRRFSPLPGRASPASRRPDRVIAAGIQVMMNRPVTVTTSYGFQANMHGTDDTPTTMARDAELEPVPA